MNNNKISIGTVQFAVNAENNSHLLVEHPLGSISRMISELLSQRLNYLGIDSGVAKLIVTKPEEKGHKQLIYTSMLPLETAKKILETRYFDYCLYGEIKFENTLEVEISVLDSNEDKNLWRRLINSKKYNFSIICRRIIEETLKIIKDDTDLAKINFLDDLSPDNLSAWGWFSVSFEEELDTEDRIYALNKAIEASPDFIEAKLKLISLQLKDKYDESIKSLDNLKNKVPDEMFEYYADILLNQEKFIEAEHFYKSVKTYETEPRIIFKLLRIYFETKKIDNFDSYLEKYLSLEDKQKIDYHQIGYYLISKGQNKKALNIAKQGLEANPETSGIYSMLGFINMSEENYHEAIKNYEKSFSLGISENILEDWSSALLKLNDFEATKNTIEKYSDDLPFNSGVECNLAIAYLNLNNEAKATKILESAVRKDKNNARANALLGNIYFRQKSYARAQKYLLIASNLEPDNYNWYKVLGDLFYDSGDQQEAVKYYNKVLNIIPDLKISRYICYQADKLKEEGKNPDSPDIRKLQEAFNKYNLAAKIDPELLKPVIEMGNLCLLTEDLDKALEFFEGAAEKFPDSVVVWEKLYESYSEKARGFFRKSWKTKADHAKQKYDSLMETQVQK